MPSHPSFTILLSEMLTCRSSYLGLPPIFSTSALCRITALGDITLCSSTYFFGGGTSELGGGELWLKTASLTFALPINSVHF
jgi:hypothetical protein